MDVDIDNRLTCQFMQLTVETEPLHMSALTKCSVVATPFDTDNNITDISDGDDNNVDDDADDDNDADDEHDDKEALVEAYANDALLFWSCSQDDNESMAYNYETEYAG